MPANPSMGFAAKLGMGSADPVTESYEFKSEAMGAQQELITTDDGLRASRSREGERLRLCH